MKSLSDITHPELVAALWKPGDRVLTSLDHHDCDLFHAGLGLAGEVGELIDAIKKTVIYRQPIDRENVIEELGDLEFYMEVLRSKLGITREETLTGNIKKLSKRYVDLEYTDARAKERADKVVSFVDPSFDGSDKTVKGILNTETGEYATDENIDDSVPLDPALRGKA